MLRQRGLAQLDALIELTNRYLTLRKHAHDHQAALIGQTLEEVDRIAGVTLQGVKIHPRVPNGFIGGKHQLNSICNFSKLQITY